MRSYELRRYSYTNHDLLESRTPVCDGRYGVVEVRSSRYDEVDVGGENIRSSGSWGSPGHQRNGGEESARRNVSKSHGREEIDSSWVGVGSELNLTLFRKHRSVSTRYHVIQVNRPVRISEHGRTADVRLVELTFRIWSTPPSSAFISTFHVVAVCQKWARAGTCIITVADPELGKVSSFLLLVHMIASNDLSISYRRELPWDDLPTVPVILELNCLFYEFLLRRVPNRSLTRKSVSHTFYPGLDMGPVFPSRPYSALRKKSVRMSLLKFGKSDGDSEVANWLPTGSHESRDNRSVIIVPSIPPYCLPESSFT